MDGHGIHDLWMTRAGPSPLGLASRPVTGGEQPGPVYDNALKLLAADDLHSLCAWLGVAAQPQTIRLSETLPRQHRGACG